MVLGRSDRFSVVSIQGLESCVDLLNIAGRVRKM